MGAITSRRLSVNNTTGVISAPTTVDTAGTAYVIYSNSSSASYSFTITFTVRTPRAYARRIRVVD